MIKDIKMVLDESSQLAPDMPIKDKAKHVSCRLREITDACGVNLKLRKNEVTDFSFTRRSKCTHRKR